MTRRVVSKRENGVAATGRRALPRLLAVLAVVLFVSFAAATVGWVGTYLVPVVVVLGVVVVSFGLLVWVAGKLDDRWYTLP